MIWFWTCPKCGLHSRLLHRYRAGLPAPEGPRFDVGQCVGQLILRFE